MSEIHFEFKDNAVVKYTLMPEAGESTYKVEVVMNKETFQECYKKWIEPQESVKNGTPLDDVLDKISAEIKELSELHCIQVMDREDIPLLALDIIEKYKGDKKC